MKQGYEVNAGSEFGTLKVLYDLKDGTLKLNCSEGDVGPKNNDIALRLGGLSHVEAIEKIKSARIKNATERKCKSFDGCHLCRWEISIQANNTGAIFDPYN